MSSVHKLSGQGKPGGSRLATFKTDCETEWRITAKRSTDGPISIDVREYKRRGEIFVPTHCGLTAEVASVAAFWEQVASAVKVVEECNQLEGRQTWREPREH